MIQLTLFSFVATVTCFVPHATHRCSHAAKVVLPNNNVTPLAAPVTRLHLQGDYLFSLERMSLHGNDDAAHTEQASDEVNFGDPYAAGVAEAYGLTDTTGMDGFDESADAVGPGIYGGSVQRDPLSGEILIGTQYENHNHKPGPLYDGNGYSLTSRAIHRGDTEAIQRLLRDFPQLIEEISTGGARPLHVCGMSPAGQLCAQTFVDAGADVHAVDTYNYNALHRMASNDLDVGAEALVKAGVDPNAKDEGADSTPIEIAKRQRAIKFLMTMQRLGHYD
mmetsp:Transcript_8614/g.14967  ORF Transcript_8614/g.14967 Transcript_8614/m.14967 type:complete len:278 (+) Transcript_8614:55-888(+)|eukprot:CAMPEP_0183764938 /NCGR_PEP_ID=MMETSP0739-20130205/10620_1 /TAXON_ID=385413 /ORGANISM="Thalassiosira miniscula, Strain CCMP1093" /LENGTH=277 /DNA_ID=CAMNT_0026003537 /DNA_START=28 /DNA_END=861 /DNA_ORIENTATION=+